MNDHLRVQAEKSGLTYIESFDTGYLRRIQGRGFTYLTVTGTRLKDKRVLKRIKSLVIPPAWQEVWICKTAKGHIQATGYDDKKRKQYIYHPSWNHVRELLKYERLVAFYAVLPNIRKKNDYRLKEPSLTKTKVLAAIVKLIDKCQIRIGNKLYQIQNGSHGVTTLKHKNVALHGFDIELNFKGKSGVKRHLSIHDKKIARIIEKCQALDGQYLFSYLDDAQLHAINSSDVNNYLHMLSDIYITAKDFRTWWANVYFINYLLSEYTLEMTRTQKKHLLVKTIKDVSSKLGNTPAVCKNNYIHPGLIETFESGKLFQWLDSVQEKAYAAKPYVRLEEQFCYFIMLKLSG